jgi:hypothetical protein
MPGGPCYSPRPRVLRPEQSHCRHPQHRDVLSCQDRLRTNGRPALLGAESAAVAGDRFRARGPADPAIGMATFQRAGQLRSASQRTIAFAQIRVHAAPVCWSSARPRCICNSSILRVPSRAPHPARSAFHRGSSECAFTIDRSPTSRSPPTPWLLLSGRSAQTARSCIRVRAAGPADMPRHVERARGTSSLAGHAACALPGFCTRGACPAIGEKRGPLWIKGGIYDQEYGAELDRSCPQSRSDSARHASCLFCDARDRGGSPVCRT